MKHKSVLALIVLVCLAGLLALALPNLALSRARALAPDGIELRAARVEWLENRLVVEAALRAPLAAGAMTVEFDTAVWISRALPAPQAGELIIDNLRVRAPLSPAGLAGDWQTLAAGLARFCRSVRASGRAELGDSAPIVLAIREWSADPATGRARLHVDGVDGSPTRLTLDISAKDTAAVSGEWDLTGLDLTPLFRRLNLNWSARAEGGYLRFESRLIPSPQPSPPSEGGEGGKNRRDGEHVRNEVGRIDLGYWSFSGGSEGKPYRLSVERLTADFFAESDTLTLDHVRILHPHLDKLGVGRRQLRQWASPRAWIAPSAFAGSGAGDAGVAVPVARLVIRELTADSGAALLMDRRENTGLLMKVRDIGVEMREPAGDRSKPNTFARARLEDGNWMDIKARVDFSVWPPSVRLLSVDKRKP